MPLAEASLMLLLDGASKRIAQRPCAGCAAAAELFPLPAHAGGCLRCLVGLLQGCLVDWQRQLPHLGCVGFSARKQELRGMTQGLRRLRAVQTVRQPTRQRQSWQRQFSWVAQGDWST